MKRADLITMLKEAWTNALLDAKDLREDMAESYSAWVMGLIQSSAQELSGQQPQGGAPEGAPPQGGAPQQGAPMPAPAGGGM